MVDGDYYYDRRFRAITVVVLSVLSAGGGVWVGGCVVVRGGRRVFFFLNIKIKLKKMNKKECGCI